MADRAVVGRDPRVAQQPGALGVCRIAEAEQYARPRADRVLQDRERRDTDAAADEDRPAARRPEAAAQRAEQPDVVAGVELREPLGPRPERSGDEASGRGRFSGSGPPGASSSPSSARLTSASAAAFSARGTERIDQRAKPASACLACSWSGLRSAFLTL
jgi:hypothetical protein